MQRFRWNLFYAAEGKVTVLNLFGFCPHAVVQSSLAKRSFLLLEVPVVQLEGASFLRSVISTFFNHFFKNLVQVFSESRQLWNVSFLTNYR